MQYFFSKQVWAHFQSNFEFGFIEGMHGCKLRYASSTSPDEQFAVIVLGGRTEFCEKYAELFYSLKDCGCTLYSLDHRGQGLSGRLLKQRQKGHVDQFSDYGDDLSIFINSIVKQQKHQKIIVIAHSMGGTIAMDYHLRYPGNLDTMILSAPMLGINTDPLPHRVAEWLVKAAIIAGKSDEYILGSGYYDSSKQFEDNKLTSSRERFAVTRELFGYFSDAQLGGPTYGWVDQSFQAMETICTSAGTIDIPVVILQGEADEVVENEAQSAFCSACTTCTLHTIEGALHEILMEKDDMRNQALAIINEIVRE